MQKLTASACYQNWTIHGLYWGSYGIHRPGFLEDSLRELLSWMEKGLITIHISHIYSVSEVWTWTFKHTCSQKLYNHINDSPLIFENLILRRAITWSNNHILWLSTTRVLWEYVNLQLDQVHVLVWNRYYCVMAWLTSFSCLLYHKRKYWP